MSRGPGRIERAVEAAMDADPDNALTIEDLCERIFAGVNRVEKKHRVSVLRAVKNVLGRRPDLGSLGAHRQGGTVILFHRCNLASYGIAKAKSWTPYRSRDKRIVSWWSPPDEAKLRSYLAEGGQFHARMSEGGDWWRDVRYWQAQRDGDADLVAQIDAEHQAEFARLTKGLLSALRGTSPRVS